MDSEFAAARPIAKPGRNCLVRARSERVAFLIDGVEYFAALAAALERARHSVFLLGWDFHSRTRLRREAESFDESQTLAALLNAQVEREPGLRVHILEWDFPMLYALEREPLPFLQFGMRTHPHVKFRTDGRHPPAASHHQKIAVIDDSIAFCGGLDLTACRWDTPEHGALDARRSDPGFENYSPFHDVQMAVDGDTARELGAVARQRWAAATRQRVRAVAGRHDAWPDDLRVDARDVGVALSRTQPEWKGQREVREVEALYVDSIRAARRSVVIENQYMSSSAVRDALEASLQRPEGPEIVLIGPEVCGGWLECATMGTLRARLLETLRAADHAGRLRAYHPRIAGVGAGELTVHSKVCVIDDDFLRIGSANLANRSMGFDTECDLSIEAENDEHVRAIVAFRSRLLGEHLGVSPEDFERETGRRASLIGAIEALRGGDRSLEPLDAEAPEWIEAWSPDSESLDPERPVDFATLRRALLPDEFHEDPPRALALARLGWTLVLLALLAALWRWTPLAQWTTPQGLAALAEGLRHAPAAPLLAWLGFVAASLLMVPVTVLIVASALTFGWALGSAVALAGALASALLAYAIGRRIWRDAVRRLLGKRLQRVGAALEERGVLAMAALRVVPVAPFTIVNLAAGASRVRPRDFALGTLLGMTPGALVLALVADRALALALDPGAVGAVVVIALAGLLAALTWALRRWLG